jgi:hypothetical protein
MAGGMKGLKRVRTAHGCHAQASCGGAYKFYPAGSALPNEWDLGNGWTVVRHSSVRNAKWIVCRLGTTPIIVPTLAAARAVVEGR